MAAGDLANEENHGRRVLLRGMNSDARMCGARTACHHADAGSARQLSESGRHIAGSGFVTAAYHLDLVFDVRKRIQYRQVALARYAEYVRNLLGDEYFH